MSRFPHSEVHMVHRIGWLRAAVLGANDGLVSTASLVVGVAAAGSGRPEILIAGLAGLVAGAMSMAAGEYVSVSSQTDAEQTRTFFAINSAPLSDLMYSGGPRRMNRSVNQSRPFLGCFCGTFSPSRRQIRSTIARQAICKANLPRGALVIYMPAAVVQHPGDHAVSLSADCCAIACRAVHGARTLASTR